MAKGGIQILGAIMGKKRKKEDGSGSGDEREGQRSDDEVDQTQKYQVYNKKGYSRKYPDNSTKTEFVVFLSHDEDNKPFTDKDRMKISLAIRKYCVTGVLHLRTMNRYKVAITFDVPNNANIFIQNAKLLDELGVTASIPAADTEATGVITAVPTEMSNKQIFSLIDSSRNIIQVRRLMRRVRDEGGKVSFQPTQTVAVTFASTQLPEYVYLNHWRHEVSVYVPPVKQCLRCLRFGHIAKFCRNAEVCSICTASHNFRACTVKTEDAKCANCGGNHVAIAAACPMKKQKIEENKVKARSVGYSDLFNEKSFPKLTEKSIETHISNLTKSDIFMNLLVESIMKVISNKNLPINTGSIKESLRSTFSKSLNK